LVSLTVGTAMVVMGLSLLLRRVLCTSLRAFNDQSYQSVEILPLRYPSRFGTKNHPRSG
jgi:hypothetical protein